MKESTTYQAMKEEGRMEEVRRLLLRIGEDRFGAGPTAEQEAIIGGITMPERLEDLVIRTPHANTWTELLEAATSSSRGRRKRSS